MHIIFDIIYHDDAGGGGGGSGNDDDDGDNNKCTRCLNNCSYFILANHFHLSLFAAKRRRDKSKECTCARLCGTVNACQTIKCKCKCKFKYSVSSAII